MVLEPMSPTVMQTYRDTLLVGSAPSFIDSSEKIIPVAVVAGAITVTATSETPYPIASSTQAIKTLQSAKAGVAITAGTGLNLGAVTSGKVFYVDAISVYCPAGWVEFRDGTTIAGARVYGFYANVGVNTITFAVPKRFSTGVFVDTVGSGTLISSVTGYEQ